MPKGPFAPSDFSPTEWSTAAEKADFGNTLLRFIEAGWKPTMFTKKLYSRLSMCFGHIAHTNLPGFYGTWFSCEKDRSAFLEHAMTWRCYGDPKFTFCDVERALQQEFQARGYVELYRQHATEEVRRAELQILAQLEQKYRHSSTEVDCVAGAEIPSAAQPTPQEPIPIQGSLF